MERLHEIREEILEDMTQDSLSKRIALKLAIIQLTGELVKGILNINIETIKIDRKDNLLNVTWKENIKRQEIVA